MGFDATNLERHIRNILGMSEPAKVYAERLAKVLSLIDEKAAISTVWELRDGLSKLADEMQSSWIHPGCYAKMRDGFDCCQPLESAVHQCCRPDIHHNNRPDDVIPFRDSCHRFIAAAVLESCPGNGLPS